MEPIVNGEGGWGALGGIGFAIMLLAGELWRLVDSGDAYVGVICGEGMSLGAGWWGNDVVGCPREKIESGAGVGPRIEDLPSLSLNGNTYSSNKTWRE